MSVKKYFLSTLLLLAFAFSSFAYSTVGPEKPKDSKTVEEITSLIKSTDWEVDPATSVKVYFLINSSDEIVVLRTDNQGLNERITSHLNYKKVEKMDLEKNKIYILPVRFK